jgi:hypothetical protein
MSNILNSYRFGVGGGIEFIVDSFPPTGAYSLRYLSSTYSGAVIRVVERGTDTEQDFTPSEITDGTLATFCAANDGQLTKWYDQSGNSNDFIQATEAQQPFIVNSGVLNMDGGLPFMNQLGTENIGIRGVFTFNGGGSIFGVYNSNDTANGMIASNTGTAQYVGTMQNGSGLGQNSYGGSGGACVYRVNGSDISPVTRNQLYDLATVNADVVVSVLNINFDSWTEVRPFVFSLNSYTQVAKYREFILYADNDDQSANKVAIETNISDYYGI